MQKRLAEEGLDCQIGFDKTCDVLYIQKNVSDAAIDAAYFCKKKAKTLIFDIDDFPDSKIFLKRSNFLISLADVVTTATPEQKKILGRIYSEVDLDRVIPFPNPIDYDITQPIRKIHKPKGRLKIVWFGNSENLPEKIIEPISSISNSEFCIITNATTEIKKKFSQCNFLEWSYDDFSSVLQEFDVCVLSHAGDEFENSKSANKMVTSIMHGVPVVASQTPDYQRLAIFSSVSRYLYHDRLTLLKNIEHLRDATVRNQYLQTSQDVIWEKFNLGAVIPIFSDIVRKATFHSRINDASTILKKFSPLHRQIAFIGSVLGKK